MPYNGILNSLGEILSLKIHMKSIDQEFPVKLFIMLDSVASSLSSLLMKSYSVTIQMKVIDQHFLIVPFL